MVTRWGMSDELGPLQYAEADEEVFLGYSVNRTKNMSNETAQAIDKEIRRVVEQGYERAKSLLSEHREELDTLAKALLEYETLSGDEIKTVLAGEYDRPRQHQGTVDSGCRIVDPEGQAAKARDWRSGARRRLTSVQSQFSLVRPLHRRIEGLSLRPMHQVVLAIALAGLAAPAAAEAINAEEFYQRATKVKKRGPFAFFR